MDINKLIRDVKSNPDYAPVLIGGNLARIVIATGATRNDLKATKDILARVLGAISAKNGYVTDRNDVTIYASAFARALARRGMPKNVDYALKDIKSNLIIANPYIDYSDRWANLDLVGGALATIVADACGNLDRLLKPVWDVGAYAPIDDAICALDCCCNRKDYIAAISDLRCLYNSLHDNLTARR